MKHIKKAYRKLIMTVHPDKGGDLEKVSKIFFAKNNFIISPFYSLNKYKKLTISFMIHEKDKNMMNMVYKD